MNNQIIGVLHIGADNIGYGGRSVIAYQLTQHMSAKIRNDFLVFHKIDAYFEAQINAKNGKIMLVDDLPDRKQRIYYEWCRSKKINRIMRENQYDIVHIHADNAYEAIKSAIISAIAGIPHVFIHAHTTGSQEKHNIALKCVIAISKNIIIKTADETFACSREAASYCFGRMPDNIQIIKNGIDINKYLFSNSVREKVRKEMQVENKYVIGCVGRLALEKNHFFLLKVFKHVMKIRPEAVLMLIGEGECRSQIERQAEESGINGSVMLLGNRKDVPMLLQAMDVFVLTSHYEGFGIVNIEAQAAGLPCVVSDAIPKEAKILNSFHRISLEEPAEKWAKIVCNMTAFNRTIDIKAFKENGFDIIENAAQLEKIYIKYGSEE